MTVVWIKVSNKYFTWFSQFIHCPKREPRHCVTEVMNLWSWDWVPCSRWLKLMCLFIINTLTSHYPWGHGVPHFLANAYFPFYKKLKCSTVLVSELTHVDQKIFIPGLSIGCLFQVFDVTPRCSNSHLLQYQKCSHYGNQSTRIKSSCRQDLRQVVRATSIASSSIQQF